ncbi:hypothetical protein C0J52_03376 [Blattella germanica]|nr:hypothetical protein C0J52_03376 [Blattella germanica]
MFDNSVFICRSSCKNRLEYRACYCDFACALYRDCCRDSPYFIAEQQKVGLTNITCGTLPYAEVLMISSCPQEWKNQSTRFHCEHPDDSIRDLILDVPVTSLRTNLTYRNWHCAFCNHDIIAGLSEIWQVGFECDNWLKLNEDVLLSVLVYDEHTSSWGLNYTDYLSIFTYDTPSTSSDIENCTVSVQAPYKVLNFQRNCSTYVVDRCTENWTDDEVKDKCEAYTNYICSKNDLRIYRNKYCGLCNNEISFLNFKDCLSQIDIRITGKPDFTMIFDWHQLRKKSTCSHETEEYDPMLKRCLSQRTSENSSRSTDEQNISSENYTKMDNSTNFKSCEKIHLQPHEYIINNTTNIVSVPLYNKTYKTYEYRILNNSDLSICRPEHFNYGYPDEIPPSIGLFYVTLIGISLSIFFLVIHLVIFCMTPKLRNLSSMNLASLSVSLLLLYCAFFASWRLQDTEGPCIASAVIMHFSVLCVFFWMFTIAFDISRVLRESTAKLVALQYGKHWKRFAAYSALSWLVPAVISAVTLGIQYLLEESEDLNPLFGYERCWFNNPDALLLFCVAPLFIVMILNIVFFCWSAYTIYTTTSHMRNSSNTQQDFRLYVRLALIMGLTWITGIIASYADIEAIWYLFVLLNTLQGLFIFLAFSCNKKIWNELRESRSLSSLARPSAQVRSNTPVQTTST